MADVEPAVGFRRKPGVNATIALFRQVRGDDVANEIGGGGGLSFFRVWRGHGSVAIIRGKSIRG